MTEKNVLGYIAIALGILGLLLFIMPYIGIFFCLVGLGLGIYARDSTPGKIGIAFSVLGGLVNTGMLVVLLGFLALGAA